MLEETTHQATKDQPATANPFVIEPVELNESEQVRGLRLITGEDDFGEEKVQTVYHRFRKQDRSDVINLFAAVSTERVGKLVGQRQNVEYGNNNALRRFWGKYHDGIKGYIGAEDWHLVPEDRRADWYPSHQSLAVSSLLECEARVSGEMGIDGSVWGVSVAVPNFREPIHVLKFHVGAWGQKQADRIEERGLKRSRQASGAQEVSINVGLYIETLLDLTRRVDGCTLDGKAWDEYATDEASKQRFLQAIYPAWVYRAAEVLFLRWGTQKRD